MLHARAVHGGKAAVLRCARKLEMARAARPPRPEQPGASGAWSQIAAQDKIQR